MTSLRAAIRTTFSALRVRNFRLYFTGQIVSVSGAWMQRVAQSWLVLDLTGSGTAVGGVTALQFLPLLLAAPFGGVIADRVDKRRLLFVTQSLAGCTALTLGLLVLTDRVELWMVYALAFALGMVGSFDNPARQSFVMEMVGRDRITNAVALHSVMVNAARVLGPAIAGALIVGVGIAACFLLNAASYLALLTALARMRSHELDRAGRRPRRRRQLREGFAYAAGDPLLRSTLVMLAAIGIFAYEFEVSLPLLARFTFGGDADTFGLMFAVMGGGAVVGGLHTASRSGRTPSSLIRIGFAFAISIGAVAVAPLLWIALVGLFWVGATGTSFLALSNAMLQLHARPELRARVLALRAVAFLGVRPIGGPIVGAIGEHIGPRWAVAIGAAATFSVVVWAWPILSAGEDRAPMSRRGPG
jgi:MFS family permease